jgi:LysR family transcriptional regulator, hydrogen peroxide-inducible genes activator
MNLQQIEYIVALDHHKSFSKAAEACHVTQATLSTMVKKLEAELDLILFDRKTSPILTTDCGKEIIAEAHKILFHSRQLKELAAEIKGNIAGELRLGIIPTVAGNLLHRIIPLLLQNYPGLKLVIQEITTTNIITQLKRGELDAGIVSTPLPADDLEVNLLYYEKLMLYGKLKNNRTHFLSPRDIAEEQIWLLEQGNCLSNQIINLCDLHARKFSDNLDFKPNSFDSLINIVDNVNGLTLIPELYFADLPAEKKANVKDFDRPFPVREVSLVFYRPYAKLRLITALAELIRSCIQPVLHTSTLINSDMIIAKM